MNQKTVPSVPAALRRIDKLVPIARRHLMIGDRLSDENHDLVFVVRFMDDDFASCFVKHEAEADLVGKTGLGLGAIVTGKAYGIDSHSCPNPVVTAIVYDVACGRLVRAWDAQGGDVLETVKGEVNAR